MTEEPIYRIMNHPSGGFEMRIEVPACPVAARFYLPYIAYHQDAEERHAAGERQQKCGTCLRFRWPEHCAACPQFTPHTGTQ